MQIEHQKIAFSQIAGISPLNVRHGDAEDDISGLKATMMVAGMINPLLLHERDGVYLVLAGRRRFRALIEIHAEDADDHWDWDEIPVKVARIATDAELIALSCMENTQTLAMHPVRQFEAFAAIAHALPSTEAAIEVIAKEFGLTRQLVKQRLALGNLSPKIRAAWLSGALSAEAAKAYAECDDIAAQEAYFDANANSYQQDNAHNIRFELLANWIKGDDKLALCVGAEAYLKAGGELRDSLFAEEQRFSKPLLEKLAREKLVAAAEAIKREEMWGFIVTQFDEDADAHEQMEDLEPDYLPEEETRLEAVRMDLRNLHGDNPGGERLALLEEAAAIEAKAICRAIPMVERLSLGLLASIDWQGVVRIERAIALPEGADFEHAAFGDHGEGGDDVAEPRGKAPRAEKQPPLPPEPPIGKHLRTVLDEAAGAALHDACARSVNLALIYAVAKLGCAYGGEIMDLKLHGRRNWKPALELLQSIAHINFDKALALVAAAPLNDVTVAFCELIGASIDPARDGKIDAALALISVAAGQSAIHMDLVGHFSPDHYFLAATRDAAIAALRETEGQASAVDAAKLGKKDLAERAALIAKDFAWIPKLFRDAAIPAEPPLEAAPVNARAAKPSSRDERTTIQAMQAAIEADDDTGVSSADRVSEALPSSGEQPEPTTDAERVSLFLDEMVFPCPMASMTKASALFAAYDAFAAAKAWPNISGNQIAAALAENKIEKKRLKNGVHYISVELRGEAQEAAQ